MAQAYTLIQAVTVGAGGAASIDFTNIPATYTDLKLVLSGRLSVTDIGVYMYFNSDTTAANYSFRNVYGNGANTFSINSSAEAVGTYLNESGYTASTFGSSDIYIPNYTSSNKKSFSTDTTTENNATTSYAVLLAGLWSGTSAITGIKLQPRTSGNFVQYSTAYLYGIGGTRATGGTITADVNYTYHTFTSSGSFTALENIKGAETLVIAGGGSGGWPYSGGGGAGGVLYSSGQNFIAGSSYSAIVGAGAAGAYNTGNGKVGSSSQFLSFIPTGGGGGVGDSTVTTDRNGGSGGGGHTYGRGNPSTDNAGGTAVSSQGNSGGAGAPNGSTYDGGGGGGGAGAVGGNATSTIAGNGGIGTSAYSAWGYATSTGQLSGGIYYYAGGGGGGTNGPVSSAGIAGLGGGGRGAANQVGNAQDSEAGTANTGGGSGGGGAGNAPNSPKNGGSGIIIIRYPN